jgi:hypothetical protein
MVAMWEMKHYWPQGQVASSSISDVLLPHSTSSYDVFTSLSQLKELVPVFSKVLIEDITLVRALLAMAMKSYSSGVRSDSLLISMYPSMTNSSNS